MDTYIVKATLTTDLDYSMYYGGVTWAGFRQRVALYASRENAEVLLAEDGYDAIQTVRQKMADFGRDPDAFEYEANNVTVRVTN